MTKEYKNIKGIAFDFFGVFSPMVFPIHGNLAEKGFDKDKRHQNQKYLQAVNDHNLGRIDEKEYIKRVGEAFGVKLSFQKSRIRFNKDRLNHNLIRIVKKLKEKYKLGLLSNNSKPYAREFIFKPKLDRLFDAMVLSHLEGIKKPEPKIYLLIAERMGLKPFEILYLDDQPARLPPKELGFKSLLYEGEKTDKFLKELI